MAIPERQLEIWSHQGATTSATAIYQRIKNALQSDTTLSVRKFDVFLQGSYRNSTNIRGDSDVDVVVMLKETYMSDYDYNQLSQFIRSFACHTTLTDFRRDVFNAIRRAFPNHNITEGGKSIKIPRTDNNIPADVVPCLEYRLYRLPKPLLSNVTYISGIWLWDEQRNHSVISFPKQSHNNGVYKHEQTNQWYKPTVRIFKNARGRLEDNGLIRIGTVSSHVIEGLLYNVPDKYFGRNYSDTFINVVDWLNTANLTNFFCQNGIQRLFSDGQWTEANARAFIDGLIRMWNQWG